MTFWTTGHEPSPADFATLIPLAGVLITNTGNPIGTTTGTTELDFAKYALSGFTLSTSRWYLARIHVTFTKTQGTDSFFIRLRGNTALTGTQVHQSGVDPFDGLTIGQRDMDFMFQPGSAYTSLRFSVVRSSGTGTFSYFGASGGFPRAWALLYDVGDSTNIANVA